MREEINNHLYYYTINVQVIVRSYILGNKIIVEISKAPNKSQNMAKYIIQKIKIEC